MTNATKKAAPKGAAGVLSEAEVRRVAAGLVLGYRDLCEQARLNGDTAAALLGISRSRLSQLIQQANGEGPNVSAHLFLSMVRAVERVRGGMAAGWLPVSGFRRTEDQQAALARLLAG